MEFLPEIIFTLLSVILIPALVQGFRFLSAKFEFVAANEKKLVTLVAFTLSLVAAFIWSGTAVIPPVGDDPAAWFQQLMLVGSAFFAAVKGVYDFILKSYFEKRGFVP